jgi:TPR repeat protein
MKRSELFIAAISIAGVLPSAAFCGVGTESTSGETLRRAEALKAGLGGRYDPEAAERLFEEAAAQGDAVASFRLALVLKLRKPKQSTDQLRATGLYERSAQAVEALATQGEAYAQYLVGTAALIGLGASMDLRKARHWLELAVEEDEPWAWHNLAWMMETGRGFEAVDVAGAVDAYRSACAAGNVVSMFDFARLTLTRYNSGALCDEGLGWLERSARAGHTGAAAFLGKLLLYGRGDCVSSAPGAAIPWLRTASTAGESGADYDLGLALLTGTGVEEGAEEAIVHLERSAARSDALAVETLAFLHATGIAVARDPAKTRSLLEEAARLGSDGLPRLTREAGASRPFGDLFERGVKRLEALAAKGDPTAASLLSGFYLRGAGVERNEERAVQLAEAAAAAGDGAAMRILAEAYRDGNGVPQDVLAAVRWWRQGAEAGDSFCMMFYSQALLKGEVVDRDLTSGLAWLTRSAEAGNWWAMGDLGHLYDEGWYGLQRDQEKAAYWKRARAKLGDREARGWLLYHGYPAD